MEQHTVVKKMMLTVKIEGSIPLECFPAVRDYFKQMYAAGYDQRGQEINQHSYKAIGQYDRNGKLINTFKSRREAARKTGFTENGIYKAIKNERPTKQGWIWKYLMSEKLEKTKNELF